MAKKKRPEHEEGKPKEKGKDRGARGSGHFVTVHEGGESHAVWIKGPAPRGMSHAGRPKGLATAGHRRGMETRGRDAAQRADFISGGHVTGRTTATAAAGKEAARLRTAREAHNAGVRQKAGAAHVAGQVKGRQQGFRAKVAEAKAGRAGVPAVVRPSLREQAAAHRAGKGDYRERARVLAARSQKIHQKTRAASLKAEKTGNAAVSASKDQRYRAAFRRTDELAIRSGLRDPKGMIEAKFTVSTPPVRPAGYPYPSQGTSTSSLGRQSSSYGSHGPARKAERETKLAAAVAMLKEQRAAAAKPSLREQPDARTQSRSGMRAAVESARLKGSAARNRKAMAIRSQRAKLADARRDPSAHTEHAPGTVTELKTNLVHFDPERFQYKLAAQGQHGVTDALKGVNKYDPELGGVLQVWKDPANSKVFVINGHHRLDLANKLSAEKVAVRFIHAKTAEEARATGAITNIAEGRGSSLDAAKFFRDTGLSREHLESRGVPMRERVATEGLALSNLHEPIFKRVVAGELTPARGAIIGNGLSHAQQSAVMKSLDKLPKGKAPSDATLRETVEHAKNAPTTTKTTHGLFGDDQEDISLALHRGEAAAHVRERLSREKKVFGTVARERNAADLERGGNVINAAESGKISQAASENLATFDLLKHRSGPVSKLLNEAAERVHKGEKKKAVHDEIYRRLPAAVRDALAGR